MGDSSLGNLHPSVLDTPFRIGIAAVCFLVWVAVVLGTRPWVHRTWILSLACGFLATIIASQGALTSPEPIGAVCASVSLALLAVYFLSKLRLVTDERQRVVFKQLLLAYSACLLVAYFSGEIGSASRMRGLMIQLGMSPEMADSIMFVVRKSIHLSFYALSGGTVMAAGLLARDPMRLALRTALLFAVGLACFDELRQTGAVGRGASITDVGIDSLGATIGIGIASLCSPSRKLVT